MTPEEFAKKHCHNGHDPASCEKLKDLDLVVEAEIERRSSSVAPLVGKEFAKACLTQGGRRTTEAEIDRFLEEVKAGVPVMPVTFMCSFLEKWAELYGVPHPAGNLDEQEAVYRTELGIKASFIFLQIRKSNLLSRLVYGGEEVRTEPCPVHKGRWSGCVGTIRESACEGACLSGSNVTGWCRPGWEEDRCECGHSRASHFELKGDCLTDLEGPGQEAAGATHCGCDRFRLMPLEAEAP